MPHLELRAGTGALLLGVVPSAIVAPQPWAEIARRKTRDRNDTEPGHRVSKQLEDR